MNKKLIALFALAPMMLASCQPGTEGNSSSSSTGNDSTPVSSTPESSSSSSSSSSSEDVPPSPVEVANYQKKGYVEANLTWDESNGEGEAGLLHLLELILPLQYSSEIVATYTKADNIFQYTGENANFNLTLLPNQAYVEVPASGETTEPTEDAKTQQVINNFKALDTVYNLFNKIQDTLDMVSGLIPGLNIDLDLSGIARPAYYRTAGSFYADAASNITAETLASNPADYANQISVSLLNGHNGYFTDVNPEIKASDGTHGTLRGYEEFTLGSTSGDSGLMATIMDLINSLGSLDIDFENLDIPGLLNLLLTFIPEFDFDITSYPVVDYIETVLDIILNGLTASYHVTTDEATGDSQAVFNVAIEGEGLDAIGTFLSGVAGDLLGMTPEVNMHDLGLTLTFNKPAGTASYEFGELALDINGGLSTDSFGVLSYGTDLHLAVGFEPGETLVSDSYFTDLGNDMEYYSSLGSQYHAFFELIKNYTKFGSSEGVTFDISEKDLEQKLTNLQNQFEALPADVKAMFPADIDITAEYHSAVELFKKTIADSTTLDTVAAVNKIFGPVAAYTGWREFMGTQEGGTEALTRLDQAISTLITGRQSAMTELTGVYDANYTPVQADAKPATIAYLTTLVNALPSSAEMATFDAGILTAEQQASFDAVDTSLLNAIPEQIFSFFGTTSGWTTDAGDSYEQLLNFYNTIYAPLTSSHPEIIEQLTALINEYQVNMASGLETDTLYKAVSTALKSYDAESWNAAGYQAQLNQLETLVSALWPSAPADYLESLEQIQTLIDLGDSWAQ